jgi:hypothetical protein
MLLNGIIPIDTPKTDASTVKQESCVDSGSDGFNIEKQFDFDYDGTKKALRKRARKTLNNIVKHILPDSMLEEEYVKDKMEQDIDTLSDLYYQFELNNVMQRSIVENVSRGNTMPRMYEVFSGMTDRLQALNKQIVSTEQQIRRTYLDLKVEIREKFNDSLSGGPENDTKMLEGAPDSNGHIIVSSSKQLIEMAKKKHKEKMKGIQEAEFTEE